MKFPSRSTCCTINKIQNVFTLFNRSILVDPAIKCQNILQSDPNLRPRFTVKTLVQTEGKRRGGTVKKMCRVTEEVKVSSEICWSLFQNFPFLLYFLDHYKFRGFKITVFFLTCCVFVLSKLKTRPEEGGYGKFLIFGSGLYLWQSIFIVPTLPIEFLN